MSKKSKSSLTDRITALKPKAKKSSNKKRLGLIGIASAAVVFAAGALVSSKERDQ